MGIVLSAFVFVYFWASPAGDHILALSALNLSFDTWRQRCQSRSTGGKLRPLGWLALPLRIGFCYQTAISLALPFR
jgi:type III secretory pathway component EscT